MNTEALIGKIGFLEGSHSNLWQVFSPFTICILFLRGCCFLLAHMPFPSPPFTKADTDDGFVVEFIYVHSCLLLFDCGLDVRFHLHALLRFYVPT